MLPGVVLLGELVGLCQVDRGRHHRSRTLARGVLERTPAPGFAGALVPWSRGEAWRAVHPQP